jgi:multidrug resistance efflux pump
MTAEAQTPATSITSAADTSPGAGPGRGPVLRRRIRLALGAVLLLLAAWLTVSWLTAPSVWYVTSTQAVVNARILTVYAPIEGTVTEAPPAVGKAVTAGSPLVEVENPLVDNSHLEELRTEAASLDGRVAALQKQHELLEGLKERLTASTRNYHEAAVLRLGRQVEEARAVAAAADALLRQRQYKRDQLRRNGADKGLSQLELVTIHLAAEAAQSKADQARAAAQRLQEELESARKGHYSGPGNAGNDLPYSQQRAHEIDIRQHDLQARVQEFTARASQVRTQLRLETERLKRQGRWCGKAPIDGVVWRRPCPAGSTVTRQTAVAQVLDASDIFVDALVSEKHFGDIRPGDPVVVKLIGSHAEVPGEVRDVLGKVALAEDRALAAEVPKLGKHEIHVIVGFADGPPRSDNFHPYHIGQPVEVRFPSSAGPLRRLWGMVRP